MMKERFFLCILNACSFTHLSYAFSPNIDLPVQEIDGGENLQVTLATGCLVKIFCSIPLSFITGFIVFTVVSRAGEPESEPADEKTRCRSR